MSMAGGTGSGVGSYYTELLSDLYTRISLCNSCIWPFKSGEVTLQNYNFLLTLNKLYETSQSIILIENDILSQIHKRVHANQKKAVDLTFNDLNLIAGHQLASLLQPCLSSTSSQNYLNELLGDLCPNNDYKLLSLNNVPQMSQQAIEFSSHNWSSLYRSAKQLLFTGGYLDMDLSVEQKIESNTFNKSIGLCLLARGADIEGPSRSWTNILSEHSNMINSYFDVNYKDKYFSSNLYKGLVGSEIKLWVSQRSFNSYDKSLTLLSNSQFSAVKIESLVAKAWDMFASKAYLHHYVKYDKFDEQLLLNSFIFAEQLIKNYKSI
jgi:tubulin delta